MSWFTKTKEEKEQHYTILLIYAKTNINLIFSLPTSLVTSKDEVDTEPYAEFIDWYDDLEDTSAFSLEYETGKVSLIRRENIQSISIVTSTDKYYIPFRKREIFTD